MVADVYVQSLAPSQWFQIDRQTQLSYDYVAGELQRKHGINSANVSFKMFSGSQEILPGTITPWPEKDMFVRVTVSLAGGKGGFGSMLRAIGAQIEKTTNREACRDLSGRRLRDINEEKRLKDWVSKQAEREREREEKKKKKLDKLRQEYHHEFHDPDYSKARSEVTDKVYEALEQGIQASSSGEPPEKKLKASSNGPALKKAALWVGVSDDEDSESDSDEDKSASVGGPSKADEITSASDSTNEEPATAHSTSELEATSTEAPTDVKPVSTDNPTRRKESTDDSTERKESGVTPSEVQGKESEPQVESKGTQEPKVSTEETTKRAVSTPQEPESFPPVDLDDFDDCRQLESLGLNHLKSELMRRGLKCGGSLPERAARLFSVKGLSPDEIDPSLLAKPSKKK